MRIKIFLRMMLISSACFVLSKTDAQISTIEKPLTNKDIVSLVSSGINTGIIKAAIERSNTNFDLSPSAMIDLKKCRTPDDIVLAMISKSHALAAAAPEDTLMRMPTGIYVRSDKGYTLVEPHMLLGSSSKGAVGMLKKTFGTLINLAIKAEITGAKAAITIANAKPIFIFILDFPARIPEEFFLIRFSRTSGARELRFQKISNTNRIINVNDSIKVSYSSKKIQEGIYEVMPTHTLQPGEYCFIYNSTTMYAGNNFTGFDFAIVHPSNGNP